MPLADPLAHTSHRPWPPPSAPWSWHQTWHHLLFAHWRVPASVLRAHVPSRLSIDEHGGSAWLGLVPFTMTGVTLRGMPPLPWLSAFAEMNLRTYVTCDGKPGVWFLRMDCARLAAVVGARQHLGLPYVWSRMRVRVGANAIDYHSRRGDAVFDATYTPVGEPRTSEPGSLEAFLTERYCLYAIKAARMLRVNIHHRPWPLQRASAVIRRNSIPASLKLPDDGGERLLHFARRIDVVGWPPEGCSDRKDRVRA